MIYAAVSISMLTLFSYFFYRMLYFEHVGLPRKISAIISDQVLIAVLAASVFIIYYARMNYTGVKRQAVFRIFQPYVAIISWVYLSGLANHFLQFNELLLFNIILIYLAFNGIPLMLLKKFAIEFRLDEEYPAAVNEDKAVLFEKYNITRREREIVELICRGKSNQQIADELFISLATVKDHVHNIFQKTSVKSRIQLSNLFR